ncbi:hypothetical protein HGM15179_011876 [Zosterops borbonicus]|uniref:Uncharacterized protein n=1 Tax=Zosterops borbonicus TaxID=364589 RepID=A0A8K1GBT0_9PASS|nr:hypothetical protein HGM15179_011876 [Zosterops borbonicus]
MISKVAGTLEMNGKGNSEPRDWTLWDAIQKELSRLLEWISVNLIMLNKVKCNVLHLNINIEWGMDGLELEKDLGILVDEKLDTSQQCVLGGQKDNPILACLMKIVAFSGVPNTRNTWTC